MQIIICRNNATGLVTLTHDGLVLTQVVDVVIWEQVVVGCSLVVHENLFGITVETVDYFPDPWATVFKCTEKTKGDEIDELLFELLPDAWKPPQYSIAELVVAALYKYSYINKERYQKIRSFLDEDDRS